ncbi:ABC transporter substrate-binding protein [Paenibacillus timonensis]|uniref:ABC transporter substrate-binding protein n=2 Tax=Paenibacillus timonensis TaxID=225915 RepID=A0ABW3S7F7_9BACL|nr:ABC transporter substrate-binding protein [Paenibacillus timonensis]MCH1639091.1 ABC transporter substrate-binding protein [Paenibacillus timonensis]
MHMKHNRIGIAFILFGMMILAACGRTPASEANPAETAAALGGAPAERNYIDVQGREVVIPADPQKIVYIGSAPGDLLALGVKPVGASLSVIASQIAYPEMITGIEDVGYPYSVEKVLYLAPDLILFDDWDINGLASLEKIAPTVVVGTDDVTPTRERIGRIADILGRSDDAAAWFDAYDAKAADVKQKLNLSGNESALSLLLMGKDMFVMGNQGMNTTLYGQLGFKPSDGVQQLMDQNERFANISDEVLPDFAGTHIFILSDNADETVAAQKKLTESPLWKTIPAVQEGRVYTIDSKYNFDDPITMDRLLDEMVHIMTNDAK